MNRWVIENTESIRLILIVLLVVIPLFLVFTKNKSGATIIGTILCASLLFTRLPDVSSFKIYGLVANLEIQRDKVNVTLEQLQSLAASLATDELSQLVVLGHPLVGMSTESKFKIRDDIIENLQKIGVADDKILELQGGWIDIYCSILEGMIMDEVANSNKAINLDEEMKKLTIDRNSRSSPDHLKDWLKIHSPQETAYETELEKAYREVWTTGSMSNPSLIPFNLNPRL